MSIFHVPTPAGMIPLKINPGTPFFIVGRNGTGKSALIHYISSQAAGKNVTYLPGSRTSLFDAEGLTLTPAARTQLNHNLKSLDSSPDTRWRNIMGNNARNEKALHDLVAAESRYKGDLAEKIASGVDVEEATRQLQARLSPLDRAKLLVEEANLPIRIRMAGNDLRSVSGGKEYSYARMSDGERAALIMISEVIVARDDTIFIIDEPELHLHPSIVVPLIRSLIKARPTCVFIVSTHELELPPAIPGCMVCLLRSITWSENGEAQSWSFDIIDGPENLPEDLRKDILGSRRRVLFTEGDDESLDVPLYSILFPGVSVRSKGGCREVERAVSGTRSTSELHRTEGFGLIDNDGMSASKVAEKQSAHVFALPVFSVEGLYYDPDVLTAVAARQAETLESDEEKQKTRGEQLVSDALAGVIAAAGKAGVAENLASSLAERTIRDEIMSMLPKKSALLALPTSDVTITTASPYPSELRRFNDLRAANDAHGLIGRYRVRSSGMLKAVAEALRFPDRDDYEAAVRSRLSSDAVLRDKLRAKLEPLTTALSN